MDVHKGRTTRTPWDPVLVQKTIATSPASQAGSTKYCSRNYLRNQTCAPERGPRLECKGRKCRPDAAAKTQRLALVIMDEPTQVRSVVPWKIKRPTSISRCADYAVSRWRLTAQSRKRKESRSYA
jgi:hypothetical protein